MARISWQLAALGAPWAETWLWMRGTEEVEAVRIAVGDGGLLPKRVDPVGFLLERAESWAVGQVAARRRVFDAWARRPVPIENRALGLAATLVRLAVDAPRLVESIETTTRWVELEDAAKEAPRVAEAVMVQPLGEPI